MMRCTTQIYFKAYTISKRLSLTKAAQHKPLPSTAPRDSSITKTRARPHCQCQYVQIW